MLPTLPINHRSEVPQCDHPLLPRSVYAITITPSTYSLYRAIACEGGPHSRSVLTPAPAQILTTKPASSFFLSLPNGHQKGQHGRLSPVPSQARWMARCHKSHRAPRNACRLCSLPRRASGSCRLVLWCRFRINEIF